VKDWKWMSVVCKGTTSSHLLVDSPCGSVLIHVVLQCFFEQVEQGNKLTGSFEVISGGLLDIDATVRWLTCVLRWDSPVLTVQRADIWSTRRGALFCSAPKARCIHRSCPSVRRVSPLLLEPYEYPYRENSRLFCPQGGQAVSRHC
jgi:hypothetical protein